MSIADAVLVAAAADIVDGSITTQEWLVSLGVLVAGLVAGSIARRVVRRLLRRGTRSDLVPVDETAASLVARLVQLGVVTFAALYALLLLGVQVGPLFAALGIGGIAIAFALRDTLENLIAGLILQLRRPFVIGDSVRIGIANEGTVLDVGFRYVQLGRLDGSVALIPARRVLDDVVVNTSTGAPLRRSVEVLVPSAIDATAARDALLAAITGAPEVLDVPAPDVLATAIEAEGTRLQVRAWHDPTGGVPAPAIDDELLRRAHAALAGLR
jgi:small-conductance mechanosensitive channel